MAQRLIFPYVRAMIICGYKTAIYAKAPPAGHGYPHYGIDISSIQGIRQADNVVRASGDGTVVWCKYDTVSSGATSLGWALAIRYDNCISHGGTIKNLIVRYMHASTCYVKLGQKVKVGDPILLEGMAGTASYHVHFEVDTDTTYPQYTPQVSAGHNGWFGPSSGARDSTVNPSYWLWQEKGHEQVKYTFTNRAWINEEDDNLPYIPVLAPDDKDKRIAELEALVLKLQNENAVLSVKAANSGAYRAERDMLAEKLEKARELFRQGEAL